ncbi:PH domain-containing protein [Marilutibacter spongiae]|uniref:PH domain-containing protein n=1 Tax=Marilutibacter spongiae TaxID=2025720 RepID=A0A7W3TM40_9GAMM|nr:PH domain-containing protein [Lysobacter spongiae]MBB1060803.1 PH domain-containing protein [Lysobacter spongiae]
MNDAVPASEVAWQALPERSRTLFLLAGGLPMLVLGTAAGAGLGLVLGTVLEDIGPVVLVPLAAVALGLLLGALGTWLGAKQYRHTRWLLDAHGLAVRRGRLWHRETRVPLTRVQHLDVKRGPLQRRRDLATLVVHTAGTANSAVAVPNLDAGDAEHLREQLGRQIDRDDD